MKHTDLYSKYKALEAIEIEELKRAVLAHGGDFRFDEESGAMQMPIVIAGNKHWESNCDCYVTRVQVVDGCLKIYGFAKESVEEEDILDDVEFGHLSYITCEIPETDEVSDVSCSEILDIFNN